MDSEETVSVIKNGLAERNGNRTGTISRRMKDLMTQMNLFYQ